MKNIFTRLFGAQSKKKTDVKNGTCARCLNPITPYSTCCIIGYDSKKSGHPRSECNHIVCFRCINILGFECDAIHVSNNNSIPTLFFNSQDIEKIHRLEKTIHEESLEQKKKVGRWNTKKHHQVKHKKRRR